MNAMARRLFELVEPIGVLPYPAYDPNETMFALVGQAMYGALRALPMSDEVLTATSKPPGLKQRGG